MLRQLPLSFKLRSDATFENFQFAQSGTLKQALTAFIEKDERFLYLVGDEGTGKTHLLQALCHTAAQRAETALYLPLKEPFLLPEFLEGLESLQLVCIDDLEVIEHNSEWQEALFHLYNRMRAMQTKLCVASTRVSQQLEIKLLDLKSRLVEGLCVSIPVLRDDEKIDLLMQKAQMRGLSLNTDVAHFLLRRWPRAQGELVLALDTLDHASLAAQRKLTIPFVKEVLKI